MPTNHEVLDLLLSQAGDAYVFGAEASPADSNPGAFDCSELIEWGCDRSGVVPSMPDGSWLQARHCQAYGTLIPIGEAVATPGALLFRFIGGDPFSGPRPPSSHVAMAQGNGTTIEARSPTHGVGVFPATNRGWSHAALIPGVEYEEDDMVPFARMIFNRWKDRDLLTTFYQRGWWATSAPLDDALDYWLGEPVDEDVVALVTEVLAKAPIDYGG